MTTDSTDGRVLSCSIPLRWGDMDAYGHINNVEVVRVLEEARVAAFGQPGGTGAPGREPKVAFFSTLPAGTQALVVEHRVKYLAPVEYRTIPLEAEVWVTELKAASLTINYRLIDAVSADVCVKAQTTIAFAAADTGRLIRLTPEQKAAVRPYVGEPVLS